MKKGKIIAGIIWLLLAGLLIVLLIGGIQKILISGTELIDQFSGLLLEDATDGEPVLPEETVFFQVIPEETETPLPTQEPEELISIPVEQTAEELAKENEKTE